MVVSDIMTVGAMTIEADDSITQAAQKLEKHGVGLLPVLDNQQLIGAISDRDIVVRVVSQKYAPQSCQVRHFMSPQVAVCFEDQKVEEAAHLMKQEQIRRLFVLNKDQKLVGMLSLGDLAYRDQHGQVAKDALKGISEPPRPIQQRMTSSSHNHEHN
ncbi:CBS domain-containing protein [Candidatus Nitronereus thalassa]|uniref:CBS domain-containing protein n=1 Tax=Candidatus Nitronereus thalassa TaxID=3020898 RepID=A0ABU3KBR3_9BACT|nr:CBS domain-containing protein [Candidatus Nitronereus thalassa]MDT7043738.1 CBS domain-containing protein [Candidatus Nitronereus thalassa]